MGPLDFALHLLNFAAPALMVGALVAFAARVLWPAKALARRWWVQAAINFAAGLAVLTAGLWFQGRDGKMTTYAALVVAIATSQWLGNRGWRA